MKSRINWLDTARFLGIFCIYLGHFAEDAGLSYPFVFVFHVPLFFFLSGCTESMGSPATFPSYVWKNVRRLLIPFYFFALLPLLFFYLQLDYIANLANNLKLVAMGVIRNSYLAGSVWFLSCLFVIKCLFFLIRRLAKKPVLVAGICILLFLFSLFAFTPSMPNNPHWLYNVDSALYYILYYMLGFYCFPWLRNFLSLDSPRKKVLGGVLFLLCTLYAVTTLFNENTEALTHNYSLPFSFLRLLASFILIAFILGLAKLLEDVSLFVALGRDTLYLCGSEYIIKALLPLIPQLVGLSLTLPNPLCTYIYTMILLVVCQYTLVPIEKKILKKIC